MDQQIPHLCNAVAKETIPFNINPEYDLIETSVLGKIRVTKHALDKYIRENIDNTLSHPDRSLLLRLCSPKLKRQSMPGKVMEHKMRKYGSVDNLEIWGHESSTLHFIVLRGPGDAIGTLVTVYNRHPVFKTANAVV